MAKESFINDYTNLALEGGGVLQYAYLGALQELEDRGILKNIVNFVGTSAGAMVAGFLACGMSLPRLVKYYEEIDPTIFSDHTCLVGDVVRIFKDYGYCKGDRFYEVYGEIMKELTGNADITFGEISTRFGKTVVVVGTNMTRQESVYFNPINNPNMPLRIAVRISISFPLYFKAVKYNGEIYVDGGVLNNYPINYFDIDGPNPQTIGMKLVTADEFHNTLPPVNNIRGYIESLIQAVYNQALRVHIHAKDWKRTIKINTGDMSSMKFDITDEQKIWLINQGRQGAIDFFNGIETPQDSPSS